LLNGTSALFRPLVPRIVEVFNIIIIIVVINLYNYLQVLLKSNLVIPILTQVNLVFIKLFQNSSTVVTIIFNKKEVVLNAIISNDL